MKRILAIAAHPDDEIIGCGGTLLKHVAVGDKVYIHYITSGEYQYLEKSLYEEKKSIREAEIESVCKEAGFIHLGYANIAARRILEKYSDIERKLVYILQRLQPFIIYVPHAEEQDRDHKMCNSLVKEALLLSGTINENVKTNKCTTELRGYEVWTPMRNIGHIENITEYISAKRKIIELYNSQMKGINYSSGIVGLNRYRGEMFGTGGYAEVFSRE